MVWGFKKNCHVINSSNSLSNSIQFNSNYVCFSSKFLEAIKGAKGMNIAHTHSV